MVNKIKNQMKRAIIGHDDLIDAMIVALLCGGHLYIEGPPGVAKTTAVKQFAKIFGFEFKRIQFTPDLLPADITGSEVLDFSTNSFHIRKGPIFANLILADEINRAGAKVQSALLEAMAEKQVTIADSSYPLPSPFMVLATANPLEHEGTFELPQAQLDRFMMKIVLDYNSRDEEIEIVLSQEENRAEEIEQISQEEFEEFKKSYEDIHIDRNLVEYIVDITTATRYPNEELSQYIEHGAGTRGSIDLYRASKAYALIAGRDFVTPSDIAKASFGVLNHRITLSYKAINENVDTIDIIRNILESLPTP